jgi:acyl transferase domain-containing protein
MGPTSQSHHEEQFKQSDKPFPLAITGFSFRFPQEAVTPEAFWKMMIEKRCASTETPSDRWNVNAHRKL